MSIKGTITFDCSKCVDSISLKVSVVGKQLTPMSMIRKDAERNGWHIGRDCLCPECRKLIEHTCSTCDHFEGHKCMGAMVCRLDDQFTLPQDTCSNHSAICDHDTKYRNPVPELD